MDVDDCETWPPGTVRLEELNQGHNDIVLQPRPSSDPNDPLNFSKFRKHLNFGLSAFYVLMVFAFIDSSTPTWAPMHAELGFSYNLMNNAYAIGCGTLAVGCLVMIPFALKYGKRPVYVLSTLGQFAVCIWSAKQQTGADQWLVNAFSCFLGALGEALCNMTIADIYFVHQRGLMTSIYVWVMNIGSSLAPVAAGYITVSQGWRWVWWWNGIFFGACFLAFVFLFEETKFSPPQTIEGVELSYTPSPVVEADTKRPTSESKVQEPLATSVSAPGTDADDPVTETTHISAVQIDYSIPRKTYMQRLAFTTTSHGPFSKFARHSWQPFVILGTTPAVLYMSIVYGVMLVWSTVMITVLSSWMTLPPYNFNSAQIGLMSLPSFIGSTLGALASGPLSDWWILYLAKRNKGIYEPEMRLWIMMPFIPFVPIGAFMFGFGLNDGASWIQIAFGYAICNFGTAPISTIALAYITDSYQEVVADALVAVTFVRNLFSTIFVFALDPWIDKVGMRNVFITINVLGTAVLLFAFAFIRFGKKWRAWTEPRYRYYAERQFEARKV